MSTRSRHQPWWLDGAERPRRALIALTAPEVEYDLFPPLMTVSMPKVSDEESRHYQELLRSLGSAPVVQIGSYEAAMVHQYVWRGR